MTNRDVKPTNRDVKPTNRDAKPRPDDHVEAVRNAFAAALSGDLAAVSRLLAEDVHWGGAGSDPSSGCTNRRQALAWMSETLGRGVRAELLEVSTLDESRVLVRLRRRTEAGDEEAPHAQIVTFRGDQVAEILVYPSQEEAVKAAGNP